MVKVFAAGAAARGAAIAELAGLQALAHPSVVRVRDVGRLGDGRMFLVTERIAGPVDRQPGQHRRRGGAPRGRASARRRSWPARWRTCTGAGIVHGDVCPANVRLAGDGRAVLIDFGLAGPPVPGDGAARGTLGYAAPEALTGARSAGRRSVRARRDAVRGVERRAAVRAWSAGGAAHADRAGARRCRRSAPGLGEGWDRLIARLLAADPGERPGSAREVLREVDPPVGGRRHARRGRSGRSLSRGRSAGRDLRRAAASSGRRCARRWIGWRRARRRVSTLALVGRARRRDGGRCSTSSRARWRSRARPGTLPAVQIWRGDVEALARSARGTRAGQPRRRRRSAARRRGAAGGDRRGAGGAGARERPLCVWLDEGPAADGVRGVGGGRAAVGARCCWWCRRARRSRGRSRTRSRSRR